MISRPHVCSRCQLRLSRNSTLSRSLSARISSGASAKASPNEESKEESQPSQEEDGRNEPNDSWVRSRRAMDFYSGKYKEVKPKYEDTQAQSFPRLAAKSKKKTLSEHPLGKLFGYTGAMKHEGREQLPVESFGEPAEVIVLRESKVSYRTKSAMFYVEEEALDAPEASEILAKLDDERGIPGYKQIIDNINDFKPKEGEELKDWEAFNDLVQRLQSSFTASQMSKYIESFSKKNAIPGKLFPKSTHFRRSPWTPGTSDIHDPKDEESIRGYSIASYTSKQRLAVRLMRECWGLALPELEEGIGEVEVELRPTDYALLLKESKTGLTGQKSFIGELSTRYITNEEEKIEGFRPRNTIRLTTTQAKSLLIIREIEHAISHIRRVRVDLGDLMLDRKWPELRKWADKHFNDKVIEELGSLTKTDIQVSKKKSVLITGIEQTTMDLNLATDAARRLLLTSNDFSGRTTNWLGYQGPAEGAFLQYPANNALSWRDKLRSWTRWTGPVMKDAQRPVVEAESSTATENNESEDGNTDADQTKKIVQKMEFPLPTENKWSMTDVTDSSTIFGNVLFDNLAASTLGPVPGSINSLPSLGLSNIFTTTVPHISSLLSSNSARLLRKAPWETIRLLFYPNPFQQIPKSNPPKNFGMEALRAFPPIEMRFHVESRTGAVELKAINAILSTDNTDIMLTHSSVDLRFQQHSIRKLEFVKKALPKGIRDFLAQSNLSRAKGQGKLETPSKIMMPLSTHVCNTKRFAALSINDIPPPDKLFEVEYLFAGLELRSTLLMDTVDGWRLRYTSVDAGRAMGKRGELSLLPIKNSGAKGEDTEDEFVMTAFKVARALDKGAGPLVTKELTGRIHWHSKETRKSGRRRKQQLDFFEKQVTIDRVSEIKERESENEQGGAMMNSAIVDVQNEKEIERKDTFGGEEEGLSDEEIEDWEEAESSASLETSRLTTKASAEDLEDGHTEEENR